MDKITLASLDDVVIAHILAFEQGYANINGDVGGATMYGISSHYNPELRERIINKTLTLSEAIDVYKKKYLSKRYVKLLVHKPRLYYLLADVYVNGSRTILPTQYILSHFMGRNIAVDGKMGPKTFAAIDSLSDAEIAILGAYMGMLSRQLAQKTTTKFVKSYSDRNVFRGAILMNGLQQLGDEISFNNVVAMKQDVISSFNRVLASTMLNEHRTMLAGSNINKEVIYV